MAWIAGTFAATANFDALTLSSYASGDPFVAVYDQAGAAQFRATRGRQRSGRRLGHRGGRAGLRLRHRSFKGQGTFGALPQLTADNYGNRDVFVAKICCVTNSAPTVKWPDQIVTCGPSNGVPVTLTVNVSDADGNALTVDVQRRSGAFKQTVNVRRADRPPRRTWPFTHTLHAGQPTRSASLCPTVRRA
jgi:hypothetical protein